MFPTEWNFKEIPEYTSIVGVFQQSSSTTTVRHGNTALASGSTYNAGESLTVLCPGSEAIAEATNGALFGTCKRSSGASTTATLTMPSSGTVEVWCAHADGSQGPIFATNKVSLSLSNAPVATKLAFTAQPSSSANAGTAFGTQPSVTVQDASSNAVTASTASVTLSIKVY